MDTNHLESDAGTVPLVELARVTSTEAAKRPETTPPTPVADGRAAARTETARVCEWAFIDMGALPEESGK